MTTTLIVAGVVLTLAITAFVVLVSRLVRTQRGTVVYTKPDGSLLIVTPHGRAHCDLVVHEDMGRVYRIYYRFGRDSGVIYSPPTPVLARERVTRLIDSTHPDPRKGATR